MYNSVFMFGKIASQPTYSHSSFDGTEIFKFDMLTLRKSGVSDSNVVLVAKENIVDLKLGDYITVYGSIRTANLNNHLLIFIRAYSIFQTTLTDFMDNIDSTCQISGYICKAGEIRLTPLGRTLIDFTLAINYGKKSSYLPCIAWENTCSKISSLAIGTPIVVSGRLQSRNYIKKLETGAFEKRIAYEFSITDLQIVSNG